MTTYRIIPLSLTTTVPTLEVSVRAYLLADDSDRAILIDAGFQESVTEIERRLDEASLTLHSVWLTHYHPDHALGALPLAQRHGVDIHIHPLESARVIDLYQNHYPGFTDLRIVADLTDGHSTTFADTELTVLHIPGHTHGHIAIFDQKYGRLFAGDHVIPEGTVWIGPPDGHLCDYLDSLDRLLTLPVATLYPGHGDPVAAPHALMVAMKQRRLLRESDILATLQAGELTAEQVFARVYSNQVPTDFAWAAKKMVVAHLQKLLAERLVRLRYDVATRLFFYRAAT